MRRVEYIVLINSVVKLLSNKLLKYLLSSNSSPLNYIFFDIFRISYYIVYIIIKRLLQKVTVIKT